MRKIGLSVFLLALGGCTTTGNGSMNAPGSSAMTVSYAAVNNSRMSARAVDVQAINAAIAADDRYYWAPEDEVLQQSMDENF
ncbi:hypothetical protein BN59_02164 [Legionella massiliensis]|uniref:Uncharacterized protein n=1 Tax=Legionella massiliensis TaxID=1034943 RepID=A0A078KY40_9GAMM|nr:hypothetical protein [Legionella massiliensis]CDZ77871.1 hypothetical protein BN59_02164 [Legionella massiliensis]CEE13609.1 hypothetical protein BN1094_02164 [Legionella massiliensis]